MVKKLEKISDAIECIKKDKDFQLKTKKGYILHVGGILTKLEGTKQYFAIEGKWKPV